MKNLLVALATLITLIGVACFIDTHPVNQLERDLWRRTNHGWEKKVSWRIDHDQPTASAIHPGLVASMQLLASVGGMLATCPSQSRESRLTFFR